MLHFIILRFFSINYRRQQVKMTNIKMGFARKQSVSIFPKNEHFLPPDMLCAYQRLRNIRFSENLAGFFFL